MNRFDMLAPLEARRELRIRLTKDVITIQAPPFNLLISRMLC